MSSNTYLFTKQRFPGVHIPNPCWLPESESLEVTTTITRSSRTSPRTLFHPKSLRSTALSSLTPKLSFNKVFLETMSWPLVVEPKVWSPWWAFEGTLWSAHGSPSGCNFLSKFQLPLPELWLPYSDLSHIKYIKHLVWWSFFVAATKRNTFFDQ